MNFSNISSRVWHEKVKGSNGSMMNGIPLGKVFQLHCKLPPGSILRHFPRRFTLYMGVSKNCGTPKASILIRFSSINHPFWGTPIFGNVHMHLKKIHLKKIHVTRWRFACFGLWLCDIPWIYHLPATQDSSCKKDLYIGIPRFLKNIMSSWWWLFSILGHGGVDPRST